MIHWAGRDETEVSGPGVTPKWLTHSSGTRIMCERNNLWLSLLEPSRMPKMSNDLLEVQLLWSQTIAQVVTAVEMTELMAIWEWEANGLKHGNGSLIKYQDCAWTNILKSQTFSLIDIVSSCFTKKIKVIFSLANCLFFCVPHYLVILSSPCLLWGLFLYCLSTKVLSAQQLASFVLFSLWCFHVSTAVEK